MKNTRDKNGDRIVVGSKVIARMKGYLEPMLCEVIDLKTVNITLKKNEKTFKVRAEDVVVFREKKNNKVQADHDFAKGDWVILNPPKSDLRGCKGRIIDLPNASMAMVLVPPENWKGSNFVAPVCGVEWLQKV